ncbi:IS30 family transposase [Legionella sp. 28fT52]|uniref:IS30 family transposase n=1 Tax=Legionella sp. 28fT52 TaxID=3410134 RepID=UPI003AF5285C
MRSDKMGVRYKHLSELDRVFLQIMLEKGYSKVKIAQILKIHRSTIYRELKRNSVISTWTNNKPYYLSSSAQKRYVKRRKRSTKLSKDNQLCMYIHNKLGCGWSPWQIEGRLKYENGGQTLISHETIYRYIYSDYNIRNRFYQCLRRKHKLRIKRHSRKSRIPKDLLINNRPSHINNRDEFGHWECDLMIFKRGVRSNLITLRERTSRYLIAIKNENKTASGTALALISTIKTLKKAIRSITFDQGMEFQKFEWIKDCLETDIYFCHPASPYEKGAIENGNGIIRVELPRHVNIEVLKEKEVRRIAEEINNRPLKCLDYQTPAERFAEYLQDIN